MSNILKCRFSHESKWRILQKKISLYILSYTHFAYLCNRRGSIVPINNRGRQILYLTKNVAKIAFYKVHFSKLLIEQIFGFQNYEFPPPSLCINLRTKNLVVDLNCRSYSPQTTFTEFLIVYKICLSLLLERADKIQTNAAPTIIKIGKICV